MLSEGARRKARVDEATEIAAVFQYDQSIARASKPQTHWVKSIKEIRPALTNDSG